MDEYDLNQKQWAWQTTGSNKKIMKQWPDERLPLNFRDIRPGQKLDRFLDQYSRRIDYEEV